MNRLTALFSLCFFAACGSTAASTGTTAATDTQAAADTGLAADAAAGTDAASGSDTASGTDTAPGSDTASGTDAASGTDTASGTDAASIDAVAPADVAADTAAADVAASGACMNAADEAVSSTVDVSTKVGDCASSSLGNGAAAKPCIVKNTGFSDGCAQCFADTIDCVSKNCVFNGACLGSDSAACDACRIQNCGPAFTTCSGLPN